MTSTIVPVVLSGGSGSRLWPKSRKAYPKQLHNLYGDKTMLEHTLSRVSGHEAPIIVCNNEQRFMVAEQASTVCNTKPRIILEPVGRNTAPAIAVAALEALKHHENPILVVLPADHQIKDQVSFDTALAKAISKAEQGFCVAFGIVPNKPETGYGYINAAIEASSEGAGIKQFVEKPDLETAKGYVTSGEYFWNSGMFVFSAQTFLDELAQFEPQIPTLCEKSLESGALDLDFIRLNESDFAQCRDVSIDYALMEKTSKAWCIPLDAQWSDLGSWESIWESSDKDEQGNVCHGDVIAHECEDSLLFSEHRLIAAIGMKDIMVVDTDNSLLIAHKKDAQKVKDIVDKLKADNRSESNLHRKVYRPWGSYDSVDEGVRHQVKRIEVKPGASLSLQMHHHRAEHWIVVSGTAIVQKGEEEHLLSENQSIYIPLGEKHRLTNPGKLMLELIEVQSGSYLGEDDIVRFEDVFGRA